MPSNLNLQATLSWCLPYVGYRPLNVAGNEPAVSNANLILQTIMGPPFCWRWNRATTTFEIAADAQDVTAAVPDFGFAEKAWIEDDSGELKEIEIETVLGGSKESERPRKIAAISDDGQGNVKFRLMPRADQHYSVTVMYQKKPPVLDSLASVWAPVPDELAYIVNWGFLALAMIMQDDPRFPIINNWFVSRLLAAQEGLDATKRNLFLGNWMEVVKTAERASLNTQQGTAARGK